MTCEYTRNRLISTTETFPNGLDIGCCPLLLPSMERPSATHATHDFIEYQKGAILVADGLHCFEISRDRRNTSECLGMTVSESRSASSEGLSHAGTYSSNYGLSNESADCVRSDPLEFIFEFLR